MRLPQFDIESIEEGLTLLTSNSDPQLTIPQVSVRATAFCAEAALLQFVITWARKFGDQSEAVFQGLDLSSETFETAVKTHLGLPYFVAAWILAGRLLDSEKKVLRRSAAKGYSEFLDAMERFDFQNTHEESESRANLLCIQGGKREFIRPFYEFDQGAWRVKREGDVRIIVQDIVMQLAPEWRSAYVREVTDSLAHLVKELVENSDWWARSDQHGIEYEKGIRAVTFRLITIDNDSLLRFSGQNTHVQSYLLHSLTTLEKVKVKAPSDHPKELRTLDFVELSMVDAGPGLARRWLANRPNNKRSIADLSEISIQEEEEAVVECFKKWRTSSGNSLRGVGLFSIANLLRKRNGFLRLRTGRLAFLFGTQSAIGVIEVKLKRKDISEDYVKLDDGTHVFLQSGEMIFFLRPWSNSEIGAVEGTAYSILLPV
ncbi:hypothetical protein [Bordetella sp. N]|uniref:hypothetical protein n=1 Tax=Bordetella sp. N TaxID=1746199 RepID=UPI0007096925|nr:hypothetical protein [Bordetella sp. N]ALM83107.1 hypothetical protein ASB57_09210 [Bordetella sp. N]